MEEGPSRPAASWLVAAGTPSGNITSDPPAAIAGGRGYGIA
jgi:hypothetical protein